MDLISRQAAIEALEREKTYCSAFRDGYAKTNIFEKYNMGINDGIKALKNLPTVDPVKHGKWISVPFKKNRICSICEGDEPYKFADENADVFGYCPYCGAKMDGGEDV